MEITVLDFDGVYRNQQFLQRQKVQLVDFQSFRNTNLFCEKQTLDELEQKLRSHKRNIMTLTGSGNYHYMTYLLLSRIEKPFTLILFDHHTDMLKSPSEDLISCGSWVLDALNHLPKLNKVTIIGANEDGEDHIPPSLSGRVSLFTKHFIRLNFKKALYALVQDIPTEHVYISIDKDVLDKNFAITAWDHGNMQLRQLLTMVREVMRRKTICGIDICGEYPVHTNEFEQKARKAHKKNGLANQTMLTYFHKWLREKEELSDVVNM